MNIWTFITTGAVGGTIGWAGKWLQSWFDASNQRRNAIEDQVTQHVTKFAPKYDLMSNHAYLLANALVSYLNTKLEMQLTTETATAKSYLDKIAESVGQESLFYAAKFYRTISNLFWVEGAKYYLPDEWAGQTMQDLHMEIVKRLHFDPGKLSQYLKDETLVEDFSKSVEEAKGKDDADSKALYGQVTDFRAWLSTNDSEVRELAAFAIAYAELLDQQMGSAWTKRGLLTRRQIGPPHAPELNDEVFPLLANTSALVRTAEKERAGRRKMWSEMLDRESLRFNEVFGRGWSLFTNGEYSEALEQYKMALAERPESPETFNNIANVHLNSGNYIEARSFYEKALASEQLNDKRKAIFENNLGLMWQRKLSEKGESEEQKTEAKQNAVEHCKAAAKLLPSSPYYWNDLGNAYFNAGKWTEAESAFRVASERAPNDPVIHANWADACDKMNKPDAARRHLEDAVTKISQGERGEEQQKAGCYARIAQILERQSKFTEARDYRRKALDCDYGNSEYLWRLANAYLALKQTMPSEEFKAFGQVFRSSPKAQDHYWIGTACLLQKDYLGALDELDRALRIEPDNAEYNYQLGRTRRRLGLHDMAARSYARAVDLAPDNRDYRRSLGLALQAAEMYDEALAPLNTILESNPNDVDCLLASAECVVFGKENNVEKGVSLCQKVIAANPADPYAYEFLANLYRRRRNYGDSLHQLGEARVRSTTSDEQQRLLQKQREVCDEALAQQPDNPDLQAESGRIYYLMGNYEEAIAAYRKASDLGLHDDRMEGMLAKLRGDSSYRKALELDDTSEAQDAYRKAIENWEITLAQEVVPTERAKLFNNIGTAYDGLGQRDEALKRYQEAAYLAPGAAVAHYNFALAVYRLGVLPRALAEFEESYRLGPKMYQPPYQMGNCYYRLGDMQLARERWEEACELHPDYPEALSNLGVLDYQQGDQEHRDAGIRKWERAVELDPKLSPTSAMLDAAKRGESPQLAICEAHHESPPPPSGAAK